MKVYYENETSLDSLKNKKIAILGYGSQGHAHALNLKESGMDVIIVTTAKTDEEARELLRLFGMPFTK